jgi:nucleoside-diphosphate-sugar epimerase
MTKNLITGATGFIGSHLANTLVEAGEEVRCLIRSTSNLRWLPGERLRLFTVDASRRRAMEEALEGVDVIYHLAGATKARNLEEYQKHNVTLTRELLESALSTAPNLRRFVMISSQSAAGPAPLGETPGEELVCRPITHYGQSKLAAERLLGLFPKIPSVILRPVSVYGPRDKDVLGLIQMVHRGFAPVIGSLDRRLTFVHVEDLVASMRLAASDPRAIGQTYFVTDGRVYTWREVKSLLESLLGRKAVTLKIPEPIIWVLAAVADVWTRFRGVPSIFNLNKVHEILAQNWGCSGEKLHSELGFVPRHTLESGLRQTIAWAKQAGWL